MKKQTSVEYIEENYSLNKTLGEMKIIFATAKEMEKQQIRDAFNAGDLDSDTYFIPFLKENDESENYYNKTFKSE
jgi:tRNA G37 N-methylase Trm5